MALKDRKLLPLPLLDEEQLLRDFRELGIKENHAFSIWRHVIHNGVSDIDDIPDLPKAVYKLVKSKYVLTTSTVVSTNNSSDGSTTKLLIRLQDGHMIESVIMRYGTVHLSSFPENLRNEEGFRSKQRATLCVSSQIGCSMGCTFCATGTMGLLGNLWAGEILEQLYHANKVEPIRNVVFMGNEQASSVLLSSFRSLVFIPILFLSLSLSEYVCICLYSIRLSICLSIFLSIYRSISFSLSEYELYSLNAVANIRTCTLLTFQEWASRSITTTA